MTYIFPPGQRRKMVHYDRAACDAEAARLRAIGYPDHLIELYERDGYMHVRPLGSKPTLKPEAWLFTTQRAALDTLFLLWSDPRDKTWTVNTRTLSAKSYVGGGREIRCFVISNEMLLDAVRGQEFSKAVFHGVFPDHVIEAVKAMVR